MALENGLFSNDDFAEWSKDYVLFVHITTRIPDRPNDGMLSDVGGRGFPTMAFMSGDGKLLAKHEGPRTTAGFDETAGKARSYVELSAKAAGGDRDAQIELLAMDLELGGVTLADAKTRIAALGKITDEQRAKFDARLADLEFQEAMNDAMKGDRATVMQRLGKKLAAMVEAGRVPSGDSAIQFWSYLLGYADKENDAGLFEKGVTSMRELLKDNPRAGAYLERMEKRLAELKQAKKEGDG